MMLRNALFTETLKIRSQKH